MGLLNITLCGLIWLVLSAVVIGQSCNHGDVRLRNGATTNEGRVEVCDGGMWGTVSHDGWSTQDAQVVCRQLNITNTYNNTALAFISAYFGEGEGVVVIDNIQCTGSESRLIDCPHSDSNGDTHSKDAGVRCFIDKLLENGACSHGDIRLASTEQYQNQGRVEVCFAGRWGTLTDDSWGTEDAKSICRQLGFPGDIAFAYDGEFFTGLEDLPILIDNLGCGGQEEHWLQCSYRWPDSSDSHREDAGIRCFSINDRNSSVCTLGDSRLVGGSNNRTGRLELCVDGVWGTVSDDGFTSNDAKVACRMLGLAAQGASIVPYGPGTGPIYIDNAACFGSEDHLLDCAFDANANEDSHNDDVGIQCLQQECAEGTIRLVNGTGANNGQVELCWEGFWGQPCDDQWGYHEAQVTCRRLGYNDTSIVFAYTGSYFGSAVLPIVARGWSCTGTEAELRRCGFVYGAGSCSNKQVAGVQCGAGGECVHGSIRLANATETGLSGRVEVCMNGIWGSVASKGWGPEEATVVCRSLGFYQNYGHPSFEYGKGTIPVVMSELRCNGSEAILQNCSYNPDASQRTSIDAGVTCIQGEDCSSGLIRLAGGDSNIEGRVEVCVGGVWGVIADTNWGTSEARVVCQQLGHEGYAVAYTGSFFGGYVGPIHLGMVNCFGGERSILDCKSTRNLFDFNSSNAGVYCYSTTSSLNCSTGTVRIIGGNSSPDGRVEVCINDEWGAVCKDNWTASGANVACSQNGFASVGSKPIEVPAANSTIVIRTTTCSGTESSLLDCDVDGNVKGCDLKMSAGVQCTERECTEGQVRLSNGTSSSEGRVEVCLRGKWGTVCGSKWSWNDAVTVCKQLGLSSTTVTAYSSGEYGPGEGWIWLTDVSCTGNERELNLCRHSLDTSSCDHTRDAGVKCFSGLECASGSVRIAGGSRNTDGRVEVCINGIWGTVSSVNWGSSEARVVCRQLGYITQLANPLNGSAFGQSSSLILMSAVECSGNEDSLTNCTFSFDTEEATHSNDVGVRCFPQDCNNGDVRLRDGLTPLEGRLEVCFGGQWGTVYNKNFTNTNAKVVCRQLGYTFEESSSSNKSQFAAGSGPVFIHSMRCTGMEPTILDCLLNGSVAIDLNTNSTSVKCTQEGTIVGTAIGVAIAGIVFILLVTAIITAFIVLLGVKVNRKKNEPSKIKSELS